MAQSMRVVLLFSYIDSRLRPALQVGLDCPGGADASARLALVLSTTTLDVEVAGCLHSTNPDDPVRHVYDLMTGP